MNKGGAVDKKSTDKFERKMNAQQENCKSFFFAHSESSILTPATSDEKTRKSSGEKAREAEIES